MYSDSFPELDLVPGDLWGSGNTVQANTDIRVTPEELAKIKSLRLGLFRDQTLVAWYEQLDSQPDSYHGSWGNTLFFRLNEPQSMEPGHIYCQAAVVIDQYGRERVYPGFPVEYDVQENFTNHATAAVDVYYPRGTEPEGWDY